MANVEIGEFLTMDYLSKNFELLKEADGELLSAVEKLIPASLLKSNCPHWTLPLWEMVNPGRFFVPDDPAPKGNQADSLNQEFGI